MTEASAQRPAPPPPIQRQPAPESASVPAAPPVPASAEPKPARPPQSAGELLQAAIGAAPTMRARMMLEKLAPIGLDNGVLQAAVAPEVRNLVEMSRGAIEGLLAQAAGQPIRIELQASEADSPQTGGSGPEPASQNSGRAVAGAGETGSAAADHPLVRRARELFDAGIVNVRPKQSGRSADR